MIDDTSNGYEAVADAFVAARSRTTTGVAIVRQWAASLPAVGTVVDIGCGSGEPVTAALLDAGLTVSALDASPALVAAFRRRFPDVEVACEPAERSRFFGRRFDGAVAIGLMFLLPDTAQRDLIGQVAGALKPGGRFLFTAPRQACAWDDVLTGRRSSSLGAEEYIRVLDEAGLDVIAEHVDEGENHYFEAQKRAA
ncbi:class I SAM-dependent methyltransferase [Roseitalea porphyridii]|uniref:Class I SAM-dependent methyltransferase n=1 Tax=Roseitalea porphyridii TaxID=1852022 RepID=A0A4P6V0J0_9HYPH|nr:class I SAM-dependent methyltransferase [Roseitalea porphyridii]QBK30154.1 class I SAM-dependent methyltransferase [Roseitalea porphyridii]